MYALWLDIANPYGCISYKLIFFALNHSWKVDNVCSFRMVPTWERDFHWVRSSDRHIVSFGKCFYWVYLCW